MTLFLYMLCFSQAPVSIKVSNFFFYSFYLSYPIDNLKKLNVIENVYIIFD